MINLLLFYIMMFLFFFGQCRLLALMKEAASSVTLEEIIQKHKVPSTHAHSLKHFVEKTTTLGRIEGSVEVYF